MFEMAIEVGVGFWDCGRWGFGMGVEVKFGKEVGIMFWDRGQGWFSILDWGQGRVL